MTFSLDFIRLTWSDGVTMDKFPLFLKWSFVSPMFFVNFVFFSYYFFYFDKARQGLLVSVRVRP